MNTQTIPNTLIVDGRTVPINGERNLLEIIRKAGIELPTFCYHSELSVYGACRMCLVDVEGRGIMAACSTPAESGMKVRTVTDEIREIRKISLELLLANHDQKCPTCSKSAHCKLQDLARKVGVTDVRFKPVQRHRPVDTSSPSLVRDPNKCILCGDCVRMCREIQGIGAIDFAHRGKSVAVLPSFGKDLAAVECVNCGQCAAVCPTGALTIRDELDGVWKALGNPKKKVIAQIAPAVRVGLSESLGLAPEMVTTGTITAALKRIGFARVFDTAFAADLTVIEEAEEFLKRKKAGKQLPQFTSCCPAWVKFAEQYYPTLLPNLSTCRSPQQMFASVARRVLPAQMEVKNEDLVVVSIMPCTAKKFEADRPEFVTDGIPDVDFVITTQELVRLIESSGLDLRSLQPESLDLPFGYKTGAGVIFGVSGGVTEAVLRYAAEKIGGTKLDNVDFHEVRGEKGRREATVRVDGTEVRLCVVHGLAQARALAQEAVDGKARYDLIEVMACPMGCIGGAGQPPARDREALRARGKGLYEADKMLMLHKSQENAFVAQLYEKTLHEVGGDEAHHLLHTHYQSRRRLDEKGMALLPASAAERLPVSVCVGTSCYVRGAQTLLHRLIRHVVDQGLADRVEVQASFCFEACDRGPTVRIGDRVIEKCTMERACDILTEELTAWEQKRARSQVAD